MKYFVRNIAMSNENIDESLKEIYEMAVSSLETSLSGAFNQSPKLFKQYKELPEGFIKHKIRSAFMEHGTNILEFAEMMGDDPLTPQEKAYLTTLQDDDLARIYQNIQDAEIP